MAKLGNFYKGIKEDTKELTSYFKHEKEKVDKRIRVLDELKLVDSLINVQRMIIDEIITKDLLDRNSLRGDELVA